MMSTLSDLEYIKRELGVEPEISTTGIQRNNTNEKMEWKTFSTFLLKPQNKTDSLWRFQQTKVT